MSHATSHTKNLKTAKQKKLFTVAVVFTAGLGLGALVIGQGFLAVMQRGESAGDVTIVHETSIGEDAYYEGFRDPLISLVSPTAAYRPETPYAPEVLPQDPLRGNADAPVTIVFFGDILSASSRAAREAVARVMENHQNEVRLIWKDFPNPLDSSSRTAALAARCAQQQGKFWEFVDEVTSNKLQETNIFDIAQSLGLDIGSFESCLDSSVPVDLVNRGMEEAQILDIEALPTVFVEAYRLTGAIDRAEVERLIQLVSD